MAQGLGWMRPCDSLLVLVATGLLAAHNKEDSGGTGVNAGDSTPALVAVALLA